MFADGFMTHTIWMAIALPPNKGESMKIAGAKVLVTGGLGFIGSHLVERLAAMNPECIHVVDNDFLGQKKAHRFDSGYTIHLRNAADWPFMAELIAYKKIDLVFNLAVRPLPDSLLKPIDNFDNNVKVTECLCELLRKNYYRQLVHFSSSEVYGSYRATMDESHPLEPSTPYAASKAACDLLCLSYVRTFGCNISILRPFNNYGPRQNEGSYAGVIPETMRRLWHGRPARITGDGKQTRDFIYVKDTAEAAVRLAEADLPGRVFNVCSGREICIDELVGKIRELMEAARPKRAFRGIEMVPPRPGDVHRHIGCGFAIADELGFAPKTSLIEGLISTVQWYINEKEFERR